MQAICDKCGVVGEPVKSEPGSTLVGIGLLLLGFVAFVFEAPIGIALLLGWVGYGVWRHVAKKEVCPSCRSAGTMIPVDSPRGKKLSAEQSAGSAGGNT